MLLLAAAPFVTGAMMARADMSPIDPPPPTLGQVVESPAPSRPADSRTVSIVPTGDGFTLMRNGQPYLIKGAAGTHSLAELHALGGNSVRTYGASVAQPMLDEAARNDVTVTAGIWLGQQSYMDYSKTDSPALQQQRAMVAETAARFKDHPALLMWGLGNEMETGGDPGSPAMWTEIDRLAASIKAIDPNHPVMTVVAEISPAKIAAIKKYAPHIDVLGVNAYGSAPSVPQRLAAFGWDKPYVLTEFGPRGYWESKQTQWGAGYEPTSTEKADMYRNSWNANVTGTGGKSLGAYAFVWGHKWETSETWFNLYLPHTLRPVADQADGEDHVAAVDTMSQLWTGQAPAHPVPAMKPLDADLTGRIVAPLSMHEAHAGASSANGYPLTWHWEVRAEKPPAGQNEAPVVVYSDSGPDIHFSAPTVEGAYRLYAYAADGHGGAATANVPFYVSASGVVAPSN